ncbi:MAG: hypothetical protein KA215_03245 [Flavobacterium sp.]|nr:hypothetical protein [Flavobacterium sp.]
MSSKIIFIGLICVFIFSSASKKQIISSNIDPMQDIISPKNGDYLTPIINGINNKTQILNSFPPDLYYQIMATNFSYVSDYKNSLIYWDKQEEEKKQDVSTDDLKIIDSIKLVDALMYIDNISKTQKVIMFNEAHHNGRNRLLISNLLENLKKNGYNYLALEALNYLDEEALNKRKFANQNSGTYISDPLFNNMVNSALLLNYKVVAYESRESCNDNSLECRQKREIEQAKNLAEILKKDPSAKIIVLAGYDHILEKNAFKMMAELFYDFTGINPFTIDQVEFSEKSSLKYENPIYSTLMSRFNLTKSVIPIANNKPFILSEKENKIDAHIISERTNYENHRPTWLKTSKYKKIYNISVNEIKKNDKDDYFLIQAFNLSLAGQSDIPSDQVLIYKEDLLSLKTVSLILEKGEYVIKVITNSSTQIVYEKISIL